MSRSRLTVVIALAIAGLVLVAGVTYLASTLVSQPIGLTAEPTTLGESLAPAPSSTRSTTTRPVTTTITTTTTTTLPSRGPDDHGVGHDSDDD